MKFRFLMLILLVAFSSPIYSGRGGAFAGGLIAGGLLGSAIAASRSNYYQPDVVYVQQSAPQFQPVYVPPGDQVVVEQLNLVYKKGERFFVDSNLNNEVEVFELNGDRYLKDDTGNLIPVRVIELFEDSKDFEN